MKRRSISLLALVAVLVAGCGGGGSSTLSSQEYASKLEQYLKPVGQEFLKLQAEAQSATTSRQLSSALAAADTSLQTASQKIGVLKPPSDAASSNADIVSAINTFSKSVGQTEQAVRSGTLGQAKVQIAAFKSAGKTFISSLSQIKSQLASEGVKVGKTS